jgi:hypothetical protein
MLSTRKRVLVIVFCIAVLATAFYVLAFGTAILCCAPSRPSGHYWRTERFVWGLVPVFVATVVVVQTYRLSARAYVRRRNAWLAGCLIALVVIAADLTMYLKLHGRQDEAITLHWGAESRVFSWGKAEIEIPVGFTHKKELGIDTFVGQFTSPDGMLVVRYDIGELAGEHGGMGSSETLIDGSRVRLGRATYIDATGGTKHYFKVSFPDCGCANFSLESSSERDAAIIESIAKSFKPAGWISLWVCPLLPEVLRSDCRYRFEIPGT